MKKLLFFLLALFISVPSTWALGKGTCSLTADLLYSSVLNVSNVSESKASGVGGYLYFDYQFLDWMSMGIGGEYDSYSKNGQKSNVETIDLMGRLILPNCTGKFAPYLLGGAGYHPVSATKKNNLVGHYHAMAGVGTRIDLTGKNPGSGLDVALILNAYSPKATLTKAGDLRVGYTFAFGGKGKKAKTQKKVAATPVSNDASAWMPKPFNAKKGYAKLINELVPSRMRENKLDVLNAEAKPFFAKLKETGVTGDEYHEYAAGYFTALAVEYNKNSDVVHAMSCLDKALKFSPNFKEAVDLKAKLNVSAGAWIPKPFDAHKAYTILLKELCPKRMQENKLDVLNVEAKPFFAQLTKNGFTEQQYHEYAAGYFVTLAVEFYQSGDMSRTQACLARALKLSPGYKPAMVLKAKLGETGDWMPKPFIAQKAFIKLKTVLVPARLGENKLGLLNAEAKPFFAKLSEVGIQGKAYNDYALGFFTALAVEFNKRGDKARAKEFLNKVLGLAPDFKEALDLRDRMEGKVVAAPVKAVASTSSTTAHGTVDAGWWPKPFAASTAYAKLKNELVPARVKVNKLSDLAKEAKPFFAKLKENGVGEAALNNYKAGYYAAIADNLLVQNDLVRADYYVDNALKIAPNNKYVLEVKGKIEAVK